MTDQQQYDYLATVQDNLRALIDRTPPHAKLSFAAMRAINAIECVMECYIPERDPGE